MTGDHFSLTACLGVWLLANVQVDCVNLNAVLNLDMSKVIIHNITSAFYSVIST